MQDQFLKVCCLTKAKEQSTLSSRTGERTDGFLPFPTALVSIKGNGNTCPGFEIWSPIPFPTIIVTLSTLLKGTWSNYNQTSFFFDYHQAELISKEKCYLINLFWLII